jgi:hypothetical protein
VTGAVGILLALVTGWLVLDRRRMALVVAVPFLALLGFQTWHIAAGRGVSPPSAVNRFPELIGYYVVQVIIFGLAFGAADQIRMRRAAASSSREPSRPAAIALALTLNAALSALVVSAFLFARPEFDPGSVVNHSTQGHPPWSGFLGIGLSAVVFAVLGLSSLRNRRTKPMRVNPRRDATRPQRAS